MALPLLHSGGARAAVDRRDPIRDLERFSRELSAFLDSWADLTRDLREDFRPSADVEELDDAYVIEMELPGVKREDVDIEISGRRVAVRGERKQKERVGIFRRRERTVGRFAAEVTLPGDIVEDGVAADLDEGVLTVRLPKPERERRRRIPIS